MANTPRTVLPSHGTNRSRTVFYPHGFVPDPPPPTDFSNLTPPFIVGTTTSGETLTANAGTWSPTPEFISYQWRKNGVDAPGRTLPNYTLDDGDIGYQMSVAVTGTYNGVTIVAVSLPTVAVIDNAPPLTAPNNAQLPSILGTAQVGQTLTGLVGLWTGYPAPGFGYQWLADGVVIGGATGTTYLLTTAELGKVITFQVTATNSEGVVTATSDETAAVLAAPAPPTTAALYANLGGMETGHYWSTFGALVPTNAQIDFLVSKGLNKFRLTLDGSRAQPLINGDLNITFMNQIKGVMNYCASKGAQVMLDLHDFGGRSIITSTTNREFTDTSFSGWTVFNGTIRADGMIENTTANAVHTISKNFAVAAGTHVVKGQIKAGTKPVCQIVTSLGGTTWQLLADLTSGTILPDSTRTYPVTLTPVGGGFYEYNITTTATSAGTLAVTIIPGNTTVDVVTFFTTDRKYTGDGVSQPFFVQSFSIDTTASVTSGATYGTPELPVSAGADWWGKVVAWVMANCDLAGFYGIDPMNEPFQWSADTCFNYQQGVINAVRATGFTGVIEIEGIPWSNAPTYWTLNPNLHLLNDPADNLVFQAHVYPDRDSSGSHFGPGEWGQLRQEGPPGAVTDANVVVDRIRPFVEGCEARGVRSAIGEWGNDNTGGSLSVDCFQTTVDYLSLHGTHAWLWAGGASFNADTYGYALGQRSNGMQPNMLVVVDDFYGNPAPTLFEISGPSRLTAPATTATITIHYAGRLASPVNVTLSDNGGGGTFTPSATVTVAAGANASATVTYTPNGERLVKITATAPGLTEVTGGFNFSSVPDIYQAFGIDPAAAENIIDWQRQQVGTYLGPIAQFARDSDQATYDAIPVGQAANSNNYGLVPDWAAIVAWAGGPFRLKYAYNQAANGFDTYALGPATNEGRTPAYSELPLMAQDNSGQWYPVFTTATRMKMRSRLSGLRGQVVSFATKYVGGSKLIAWDYTNTLYSFMPNVTQLWSPSTNTIAPTNTIPNERGDLALCTKDNEWHVYTTRWRCAPSSTSERVAGWQSWIDADPVATQNTGAISLNADYGRDDACVGWYRFGSGTYVGTVGPIYIFRDGDPALPVLPDDAAVDALINHQVTRHSCGPLPFAGWDVIDLDFTTATYTAGGSPVVLTNVLTGTHTRDATGLLVNSTTGTKSFAGVALTALTSKEFVIEIITNAGITAAQGSGSYDMLRFTSATGDVRWIQQRTTNMTFSGLPNTFSGDQNAPGLEKMLSISQTNNKMFHLKGFSTPFEGAFSFSSVITAVALGVGYPASWADLRIAKIRISTTPFRSGWDILERFQPESLGVVGPDNPHGLRIGVNLSGPYVSGSGDSDALIDYYISRGFGTFRIVTDGDKWTPVKGGPLESSYVSTILRMVNRIIAANCEAIIDIHEFGWSINKSGSVTAAQFAAMWGQIAAALPKSPLLGYCIMNEPAGVDTAPLSGVGVTKLEYTTLIEQPCITAIRNAGGVGPIQVSIYGTFTAAASASSYAADKLALTDPLNNLVLEVHEYYDNSGGGLDTTYVKYKATSQAIGIINWARNNGWTLYWGEMGSGNTNVNGHPQELRSFLKLLSDNRDVVRGYAYWSGGATFGQNYFYFSDPRYLTANQKGEHHQVGQITRWATASDLSNQPPFNTSPPYIYGTLVEGQVLQVNTGVWDRAVSFTYLWSRNGVSTGITTTGYTLGAADVGTTLTVLVTATNTHGSTAATTAATGGIQPAAGNIAPVATVGPLITGTLTSGSTLTLNPGMWSAYPAPTYTYQWYRNGYPIASATAITYVLTATDNGKAITAKVTATNVAGSGSATTAAVNVPDPAPTVATFTLGSEVNVSSLAADLTNVYELSLAVDPTNADKQVICAKYGGNPAGESNVVTFTTLNSWATLVKATFPGEGDPVVTFGAAGSAYLATNGGTPANVRVRRMPSGSTTWGTATTLPNLDRLAIGIDANAASPNLGRLYVAGRSATGMALAYSTDMAVTFTTVTKVGSSEFNAGFLYSIACAPDGTVYAAHVSKDTIVTNDGGTFTGLRREYSVLNSRDGGATWTIVSVVVPRPIASPGAGIVSNDFNVAVNPVTSRVHLVVKQEQQSDVTLFEQFYSDDRGSNWTWRGTADFNPALPSGYGVGPQHLAVNAAGHLFLQLYARNASNNTRFYAMASKDDGATWSAPTKVNTTDYTTPLQSAQNTVTGGEHVTSTFRSDGVFMALWTSSLTGDNKYAARIRPVTVS